MTPIESKMYYALKWAGYDPIPQYRECGYRLDFAIFENGKKLDIECDGKEYHSAPWQKAHDRKRTQVLNRHGWNVIRFTGKEIYKDVNRCVRRVDKKLYEGSGGLFNGLYSKKRSPLYGLIAPGRRTSLFRKLFSK